MGDAPAGVGRGYSLVNHIRRLFRGINSLRVEGDVAEEKVRLCRLDVVGALEPARHVTGQGQNRCMITAGFIQARHQMSAAGSGRTCAYRELTGELGLTGGGKRRSFLMAHADPFDSASSNRIGERIQGVADPSPDMA